MARSSPKETGRSSSGKGCTTPPPSTIPTTTRAAIAPDFSSIMALCTLLPARTPRQLMAVSPSSAAAAMARFAGFEARNLAIVFGEGDGYGGHPAGLGDQQQHPSINERHAGMVGFAQVEYWPPESGRRVASSAQMKRAGHGQCAADQPDAQNQERRVHLLRDHIGIDEDAGADDAAHHDHGGVEEAGRAGGAVARGGVGGRGPGLCFIPDRQPKLYTAALFAGDVCFRKKDVACASEWFGRAVTIDPARETAYRFWGDALMAAGKMLEARDKFIESVLAERTQKPWAALQNWAKQNDCMLSAPKIERPKIGEDARNIALNPADLDDKDGTGRSAWVTYSIVRAAQEISDGGRVPAHTRGRGCGARWRGRRD
jgi:hypothetical protein